MQEQKISTYQRNKYRSMWGQEEVNHMRTGDYSVGQSNANGDRSCDGTWVNFPKGRRSIINRPSTAKPCNDQAKAFIRPWANQNVRGSYRIQGVHCAAAADHQQAIEKAVNHYHLYLSLPL
ncbi:uncharacterized protein [Drosophila pseudoobscura]|uniref:Uncharacterized protein n=1 Tax=Drosophila pseudoobscura pseudoobscura TaxID=46245 RepID=A0A6I8V1D8_DROPS|nr:uncharacterized protein LOC6900094 [Drosophila pseudoobscura]